jgi:Cu2+-exporting ATPase
MNTLASPETAKVNLPFKTTGHSQQRPDCFHCGLPSIVGLELDEHSFCCPGCRGVYQFLRDARLDSYYQYRDKPSGKPIDARTELGASANEAYAAEHRFFDQPEIAKDLLHDGCYYLMLDGLHCVACSWLIEKVLQKQPGVKNVEVNYSLSRAKVDMLEPQLGPGFLLRKVETLGYTAVPYNPTLHERPLLQQENQRLYRVGVAAFSTGNIMLFAFALYTGADQDLGYRDVFHWLSFTLSLPTIFYSAMPFWRGAVTAVRERTMSGDVTIALGLATTWIYSVYATLTGLDQVYFDTACTFVFVLLVARLLESAARLRSGSILERLLSLNSRTATRKEGDDWVEVSVDKLVAGDLVRVGPGQKIPADGKIRMGTAYVDQSSLTGESLPRSVAPGEEAFAGSICMDGSLEITLEKTGKATALNQIAQFLEKSQSSVSPRQRTIDRVSRYFLLAVLPCAALAGLMHSWSAAVSVLIITCPCALGIAGPLVVSVAGGTAASSGVLFRDGRALERLPSVSHVILDKTGTLTLGQLRLVDWHGQPESLGWATALEQHSTHPMARAFLRAWNAAIPDVEEFQSVAGCGICGRVEGKWMRLGSPSYLGLAELSDNSRPGTTTVMLEVDGAMVATFYLADQIRPESLEVVQALRRNGLQVSLLSGDQPDCVKEMAERLGISQWRARCMPLDKVNFVKELQAQGQVVAFVGDGNNDAPVLGQADIGFSLSSASELSTETADWLLLRPGLTPVLSAFQLAKLAQRVLATNIRLAVGYNCLTIPVASMGLVTPLIAAVAMPISSLFVVGNSLRVAYFSGKGVTNGSSNSSNSSSDWAVGSGPEPVHLGSPASAV